MKKQSLVLTVSSAAALIFFSAALALSEDMAVSGSDATGVPAMQEAQQTQGAAKLESKPAGYENKIFRKKRAEPKVPVSEAQPKETREQPAVREVKEKKSFFGLFSGKKPEKSAVVAAPAAQPAPVMATEQPVMEKKRAREEKAALLRNQTLKKAKGRADKYISDSKEYYIRGRIEDAEASINQALSVEPMNAEAISFKNKIILIKNKMLQARKDYSEQCYFKGATHLQEGNVLDAVILVGKAVKLNPESEKARTLYGNIQEIIRTTAASMGRSDGKKFQQAIKSVLNEDYQRAIDIFRGLQFSYPEMGNYLGYASAHSSDKSNKKRSQEYIKAAIEDIRNERYKHAQESLFQALEMDRTNMEATVIMEQVDVELGAYPPAPLE